MASQIPHIADPQVFEKTSEALEQDIYIPHFLQNPRQTKYSKHQLHLQMGRVMWPTEAIHRGSVYWVGRNNKGMEIAGPKISQRRCRTAVSTRQNYE